MPAIAMTTAQRKDKRALAHHLEPVVAIGAEGLTPAVLKEADAALAAHGLIKVRMFCDDRAEREATLAQLADRLNAGPVQHIGKLFVLWRPLLDKPDTAAEARGAGVRIVKILKFAKSGHHRPQVKKVRVLGNQRVTAGGSIKRARRRASSVKKTAQD
jgi:RNA-binding protein